MTRVIATENREAIILDPPYEVLPFIRALNPRYEIASEPPVAYQPVLQRTRNLRTGCSTADQQSAHTGDLWQLHDRILKQGSASAGETILSLKIELAARSYRSCTLCGHQCMVDRYRETGKCGLTTDAFYDSLFAHIAEEPPITPCLVCKLCGCALRCQGCQANDVLTITPHARRLAPDVWEHLRHVEGFKHAQALQFVGGNPDEQVLAVLRILTAAPPVLPPLVWNNHGYATNEVYQLLDGIIDVYVMDLKFGPSKCGLEYAGAKNYWQHATAGLERIAHQPARAIIRILMLPGHAQCCHEPALEHLAQYRDRVWLSLVEFIPIGRGQHAASQAEVELVKKLAAKHGLRRIEDTSGRFWTEDV